MDLQKKRDELQARAQENSRHITLLMEETKAAIKTIKKLDKLIEQAKELDEDAKELEIVRGDSESSEAYMERRKQWKNLNLYRNE